MLRCCSTLPLAIKLLVERVNSLHTFELTCCKVTSPFLENIADIISSTEPQPPDLGRLSSLSSHPHLPQLGGRPCFHRHSNNSPQGTSFDDFGLEQLGRHVPGLLTLNVARTRVSDRGLVGLQVSI